MKKTRTLKSKVIKSKLKARPKAVKGKAVATKKRAAAIKRRAAQPVRKASRAAISRPTRRVTRASGRVSSVAKTRVRAIKARAKVPVKKADVAKKTKTIAGLPQAAETKTAIDTLVSDERVMGYLKKNVSKRVADVISLLTVPRTDDYITEKLGIKINAVRRMLNIMQNYGITNYYVSKNKDGWLSFAWYVNTGKLPSFLEYVQSVENEASMLEEGCNDYFKCNHCYDESKLIFTFDAAYEAGFKCSECGKNLERIGGKTDVEKLIADSTAEAEQI